MLSAHNLKPPWPNVFGGWALKPTFPAFAYMHFMFGKRLITKLSELCFELALLSEHLLLL